MRQACGKVKDRWEMDSPSPCDIRCHLLAIKLDSIADYVQELINAKVANDAAGIDLQKMWRRLVGAERGIAASKKDMRNHNDRIESAHRRISALEEKLKNGLTKDMVLKSVEEAGMKPERKR